MTEENKDKAVIKENAGTSGSRKVSRDILQERYLSISEENLLLKKHLKKQEQKIKQLATKLVRLVNERKSKEKRDDIIIDDQKTRNSELEQQNNTLREKLQLARQQLTSYTKLLPTASSSRQIKAKTNRSNLSQNIPHNLNHQHNYENSSEFLCERGQLLLIEAKAENQALEDQLKVVRDQFGKYEKELEYTREKLKNRELEHEKEMSAVKRKIEFDNEAKQKKVADNIQLIRLQRDSRRYSGWLSTLEAQCRNLETNLNSANEANRLLETELSKIQDEYRNEQQRCLDFQRLADEASSSALKFKDLSTQMNFYMEENRILKETNESMLAKVFSNADKVKRVGPSENETKTQMEQLEESLKKELMSKAELLTILNQEQSKSLTLQQKIESLQQKISIECELHSRELVELRVRLKDSEEKLSKAVIAIEVRKSPSPEIVSFSDKEKDKNQTKSSAAGEEDKSLTTTSKSETIANAENTFLEGGGGGTISTSEGISSKIFERCESCKRLENELNQTQSQMKELRDELNKTKSLLKTQWFFNKENQKEIEILSTKLEKTESLNTSKLDQLMKVLDERAEKMEILEKNLETIKSRPSSSSINIKNSQVDKEILSEKNNNISNEINQNKSEKKDAVEQKLNLEILLEKFEPSEAKRDLLDKEGGLFATWENGENTTKYTPIVRDGIFNSKSRVQLDSVQNIEKVKVQIHEAVGSSDCKTLAKCLIEINSENLNKKQVCRLLEEATGEYIGELHYSTTIIPLISQPEISPSLPSSSGEALPPPIPKKRSIVRFKENERECNKNNESEQNLEENEWL